MPIDTKHPEYEKYAARWVEMEESIDEQDTIRARSEKYLPPTSGMKNGNGTNDRYESYKSRARYYGIVRQSLTGIVGLMFEKDPDGADEARVTTTGQNNVELARDVARDVATFGRSILLVDAPKEGGVPFITRYHPSALINWKVDPSNSAEFTMAVFQEGWAVDDPVDEFKHGTVDRFRVYRKGPTGVTLTVYDKDEVVIEGERRLGVRSIGIFAIGSISVDPACDPVPLLPVKDCAVSMYQISADLRQDLFMSGQKQVYMVGCSEGQYNANVKVGYGAGGAWYLGESEGRAGLIESTGSAYESASAERSHEFDQAASYAVKMTQRSDNAESGRALEIRAAAQHASIYTMADSISIGITNAIEYRANWASLPVPVPFAIKTEFTNKDAADRIINALNATVNSGNLPLSPLFEATRQAGLTDKTDEELLDEMEAQNVMPVSPEGMPPIPAAAPQPDDVLV